MTGCAVLGRHNLYNHVILSRVVNGQRLRCTRVGGCLTKIHRPPDTPGILKYGTKIGA